MKIESKYDINQTVWKIHKERQREYVSCKACSGSGRVVLADNVSRLCPGCYGQQGKFESRELEWLVVGTLTIGEVRARVSNFEKDDMFDNIGHFKDGATTTEFQYMAYETGIGSGTLHNQDSLCHSHEEAIRECEKRNLQDAEVGA